MRSSSRYPVRACNAQIGKHATAASRIHPSEFPSSSMRGGTSHVRAGKRCGCGAPSPLRDPPLLRFGPGTRVECAGRGLGPWCEAWRLEPGAGSREPGAWSLEPGAWSRQAGSWSVSLRLAALLLAGMGRRRTYDSGRRWRASGSRGMRCKERARAGRCAGQPAAKGR